MTTTTSASRLVWRWCVVYTLLAPGHLRERRREEIKSHLWESEQAALPPIRILRAGLLGALHDLTWAVAARARQSARAAAGPALYVVLAALFTVSGAFSGAVLPNRERLTNYLERTGLLLAVACLGLALLLSIRRRRS